MKNNTAKWFGNKFVYSFIPSHQKSISKQRYWWQFPVVGDILSYNERILQNGELNSVNDNHMSIRLHDSTV